MAVGEVVASTLRSMMTVGIVFLIGIWLAKIKVLQKDLLAGLSKNVVGTLFLPCAMFVTLGGGLSVEILRNAWPLVLGGFLTLVVNFAVSVLMVPFARPNSEFKPWYFYLITFPNGLALGLVFVKSFCQQARFKRPQYMLDWNQTTDEYLTEDECKETGELYLFLYVLPASLLLFIVGFTMLPDKKQNAVTDFPMNQSSIDGDIELAIEDTDTQHRRVKPENVEATQQDRGGGGNKKKSLRMKRILRQLFETLSRPAIAGQLLGLIVGVSRPLQRVFFDPGSVLQPLTSALDVLGSGLAATVNLILSGTLGLKLFEILRGTDVDDRRGERIPNVTMLACVVGKMIISPGIQFLAIYLIQPYLPNDQMLLLLLYVLVCTPSANICIVMAQILGNIEISGLLSIAVFFQYVLGMVTISSFVFLAFYLVDIEPI